VTRSELQKLAVERLADAKALLAAKRWAAAYYLAGYAVECGLKACIARLTQAEEFPNKAFADKCWTHDVKRLVYLAGLEPTLEDLVAADSEFANNWDTVRSLDESSRYLRIAKIDAEDLFDAITDRTHGVMPWIRLHW
jgi:HEPN domain-containing protein